MSDQNLPAVPVDDLYTGLEDFELTDAVHPRLKIVHREAMFEDNLSGGKYPKVRLIILAMNKQRILWHPNVDDNDKPMCRSADFHTGFPTPDEDATKGKEFPWEMSGFNPDDWEPDEEGDIKLPCASCRLKEWGTHPGNKKTPYCAEQWVLSVYYDGQDPNTGEYTDTWSIALLTLRKSGLKAIKSYLTSFQRSGTPAFTAICEASLNLQSRGQVNYSTPTFRGVGKTDQSEWGNYSEQAQQMRNYLKRNPDKIDTGEEEAPRTSDNTYQPPPSAQQAQPAPQQQQAAQQAQPQQTQPQQQSQPAPQQEAQPKKPGPSNLPF